MQITGKISVLMILSLLLVLSCKKGEDDPLISLRTRKARLAGEWRLQDGSAIVAIVNLAKWERYNFSFSFQPSRYILTETGNNYPISSNGAYLLNLNIDKKGDFNFTEQLATKKITASGTWDFLPRGDKTKSKERIVMDVGKITKGTVSDFHIFHQNSYIFKYKIKELRDKKLVLSAFIETAPDADGYYWTYTLEYTFIQ
jgi:hypothetical protein